MLYAHAVVLDFLLCRAARPCVSIDAPPWMARRQRICVHHGAQGHCAVHARKVHHAALSKRRRACRPRGTTPRATGGGNKQQAARHCKSSVALWRSHCEARIGRYRLIPDYRNPLMSVARGTHTRGSHDRAFDARLSLSSPVANGFHTARLNPSLPPDSRHASCLVCCLDAELVTLVKTTHEI